ncbi:DoxX family protein, partial [Burkholderia sp. Bp9143]
ALAVVVEIGGSLCVVFRRFTWLGAGSLGMLTLVAMGVANDFWNRSGAEHFMALNSFFEHLGLIAALVLVTIVGDTQRGEGDGRP